MLEKINSNYGAKVRTENFVKNYTIPYEKGHLSDYEYNSLLDDFIKFLGYIYRDECDSGKITKELLVSVLEEKKLEIILNTISSLVEFERYESIYDSIDKYIDVFRYNSQDSNNLIGLARLLNEDYFEIKNYVNGRYKVHYERWEIESIDQRLFNQKLFKNNIEDVDLLDGFGFEDFLNELFISWGYETKDLPKSGDFGADALIKKAMWKIVVQAKHTTSGQNIGPNAVQEVVGAKGHYNADIAVVITNSYFSKRAIELAKSNNVVLIDRDELVKILDRGDIYFNKLIN